MHFLKKEKQNGKIDKMDEETIKKFLDKKNKIAFVGATNQKDKWGYKKYISMKKAGYSLYPINPKYDEIDGDMCFSKLEDLCENIKENIDYVILIVPPKITEKIVEQCKELKINKVWMQPGSESKEAIDFCKKNDIEAIYGICIVVDAINKY